MAYITKTKEPRSGGPPQPPVTELHGKTLELDTLMDSWVQDPMGRDVHSKDARREHLRLIHEDHNRNRNSPLPVKDFLNPVPEWGSLFLPGGMGAGKTLTAHWIIETMYRCGWVVYSTASTLFSQRLSLQESYVFPDLVEAGSGVFIDEIHIVIDRYAFNSQRNRSYGQAKTSLRKMQCLVIGASANPGQVGMEFKGSVDYTVIPYERPNIPRATRGRPIFPDFCWVDVAMLKDIYQESDRRLMDSGYGHLVYGRAWERRKGNKLWCPNPAELYQVSKGMDSFETFRIGEAFGIGRGELTAHQEDGPGYDINNTLDLIAQVLEHTNPTDKGMVSIDAIAALLEHGGQKTSKTTLRASLEVAGVSVTARGIFSHDLAKEKIDR